VEERDSGFGDGTLLCSAQLPGASEPVAVDDLIGINSDDVDIEFAGLDPDFDALDTPDPDLFL
jgi:hypothetical protein